MSRVLFWDFDGTLVRSDHLWRRCVHAALCRECPDSGISMDAIGEHLHTGFPWHDPAADYTECCRQAWWPKMNVRFTKVFEALGVDEALARRAAMRVRELVLDASAYNPYEDAPATLARLQAAGWRHHLLSNNYPELWQVVEKLGMAPFFEGHTISGRIGFEKPRRELFEHALEAAGHPDACVMIGDNPHADLAGAKAVDIPCILVHAVPHPDALFNAASLSEIPKVLVQFS